jgi:GrpB-like predicted nucleotidyltransferase (UPF0157 family)
VDLLGEVPRVEALDGRREALAALGWEGLGEHGIPGRRYFRKDLFDVCAPRAHLHVFASGNPQLRRHLDFRDALRRDSHLAGAYAALKLDLAQRFPSDRARYTDGKSAFVASALERRR